MDESKKEVGILFLKLLRSTLKKNDLVIKKSLWYHSRLVKFFLRALINPFIQFLEEFTIPNLFSRFTDFEINLFKLWKEIRIGKIIGI